MTIAFWVPGIPEPQGSLKAVRNRNNPSGPPIAKPSNERALKSWRGQIVEKAAEAWGGGPPIDGPVLVRVLFDFPRPKSARRNDVIKATRPDTDKLVRGLLDGLKGIAYRDDGQVAVILAAKRLAPDGTPPGMLVELRLADPRDLVDFLGGPGNVARIARRAETASAGSAATGTY